MIKPSLKLNDSFCPKLIITHIEEKILQFEDINLKLDPIISVLESMPWNSIPVVVHVLRMLVFTIMKVG